MRLVAAFLAQALAWGVLCASDASGPPQQGRPGQLVGAGLYTVPQPYEGVGTSFVPVPLANLSFGRLYAYGVEAGFRWREGALLGWRLFVSPRFMGYEAGESGALDGMQAREFSGDAGAAVTLRPIPFVVDLAFRTDILGRSGGEEATLDVDLLLGAGRWLLRPSVGLQWQSQEMVDYYYGVTHGEARPLRPLYRGDAALSRYVEIEVSCKLGERWTFVAGATRKRLGSGITESPLVDASRVDTAYAGGLFGF